ncbi:ATP-dependent helicase HrpB [Kocuria sp. TGY1127_2]|uniref:ATP-dependent helicase HrpB n=1 Tax=Kocuria sp. TGY1127_2 TaxID=2711328 RepID=UPI001FAC5A1C|nr:ATP-dependent helicase HrpB [Kocuria sp. TGY1127_2]
MSIFDLETMSATLPAAGLLPSLGTSSNARGTIRAVVEAPPGTGKTTLVPPYMANWIHEQAVRGEVPERVVVTQPRRIAARSAAHRLAQLSKSSIGEHVGYTVRGERKVSTSTRVEFVTTGVLLRRLIHDPALANVSCVILDEVHERHLDSDLAFGMLRQLAELRDDLSLIAMSATLDAAQWAKLLGDDGAPVPIASVASTAFPLTELWAPPPATTFDARGVTPDFLRHVAATVERHRIDVNCDVLVFLPGAREIDRVAGDLRNRLGRDAEVLTLMGRTLPREQDRILKGSLGGPQRIVLSTNVAESAVTVPGVRLVVDAGLDRQQRLDAMRGMSGLVTVGASKAAMAQRAGRAAREGPGVVVRCLSSADFAARPATTPPEIVTSDLTAATLDLACWGAPGGAGLRLPDPLPERAHTNAREVLHALGAIDDGERATELGRKLASVPADPRLARALFDGAPLVGSRSAAEIVAALGSDHRAPGSDIWRLICALRREGDATWRHEVRRLENEVATAPDSTPATESDAALVTALAFPDRIARLRAAGSDDYLMASGTGASLPHGSSLRGQEWLAVAEVGLANGHPLIRAASVLDFDAAQLAGAELLQEGEIAVFDPTGGAHKVTSRRVKALGSIELSSTSCKPSQEAGRAAVANALAKHGLREVLKPKDSFDSLRARMGLLHAVFGAPWPDVRLEMLSHRAEEWLGNRLDVIASGGSPHNIDVASALRGLMPWPEAAHFDELVPERILVPSGSHVRLQWPEPEEHDRGQTVPPVLAVKLQECFGWATGPSVCDGRVPVTLHLLSPARRPLAVTQDLTNFWERVYPQVRAENRGRYIKHPWPEDPWNAPATAKTKNASRKR